jgi:hypothetical protein
MAKNSLHYKADYAESWQLSHLYNRKTDRQKVEAVLGLNLTAVVNTSFLTFFHITSANRLNYSVKKLQLHGISKATDRRAPWKFASRVENLILKDAAIFKHRCVPPVRRRHTLLYKGLI